MDNWRMVKIGTTQAQRKLFYNLSKEKQKLESEGFVPDAEALSKHLDVSQEDVLAMSQRMGQHDMSLDSTLNDDTSATRLDFLPALDMGIEEELAQKEISHVLKENLKTIENELNEKELDILHSRLLAGTPVTLREIGEKYSITRERVRQIEARLLQKLRKHLSSKIEDFSSEWISHE